MNYDRTTPGKLLGHKKDDWKRAMAAITRQPAGDWIEKFETFRGPDCKKLAQDCLRRLKKRPDVRVMMTTHWDVQINPEKYMSRVFYRVRIEQ